MYFHGFKHFKHKELIWWAYVCIPISECTYHEYMIETILENFVKLFYLNLYFWHKKGIILVNYLF